MSRALLNHRRIEYSQAGEEGVIDEALRRIASRTLLARYFVEFGAWDGKHLSNTYFLAKRGFAGCMIEGDAGKFEVLKRTLASHPSVNPVNRWVRPEGEDSLDNILRSVKAPHDPDVLSIDIDGDDYWVWKGLTEHRPKVVIIELNYRDKPGVVRVNERGSAFEWGVSGSSITSMRGLADEKGYVLVANVGCNAVFVDRKFAPLFESLDEHAAFTYEGFALRELMLAQRLRKVRVWLRRRAALRRG